MDQKFGGAVPPFLWGERPGSPSNTMSPWPRPTSVPSGILIHPAIWPQWTWAKSWGLCPFWGGGAGSPSNTRWSEPRPTSTPSFILILCHNTPMLQTAQDETEKTVRTDRQRSDSIGRSIMCTPPDLDMHLRMCQWLNWSLQTITNMHLKWKHEMQTDKYLCCFTVAPVKLERAGKSSSSSALAARVFHTTN